ncbi:MAG TPA: hypothetical protein VNY24_19505 [Candidatus Acidoferrales bacterium]|jgi:hypothetical protein|nr:hypothetical protein [Candidatus Acidoferrales bacterium]
MPLLLVTYDLKTPNHDYSPLFLAIKQSSTKWWHYLNNTWLIKTNGDANGVGRGLLKHITSSDRILVIEVSGIGQGWLPEDAWAWIRQNQGP